MNNFQKDFLGLQSKENNYAQYITPKSNITNTSKNGQNKSITERLYEKMSQKIVEPEENKK